MEPYKNSKEEILHRMYRNAASIWGVNSIEDLDPVVRLLIESFASEMSGVRNTVTEIRIRLLEQLAETLTPDTLIAARPAGSVMQAFPIEPEAFIDTQTVFYTERVTPAAQKYGMKMLTFCPATRSRLVRGAVKYLICERIFYRMESDGSKIPIARTDSLSETFNRTLWIGLEMDEEIKTTEGLSFYFDFRKKENKHELTSLLSYSQWSIDNVPLKIKTGMEELKEKKEPGIPHLFYNYNVVHSNTDDILRYYRKHFLTIKTDLYFSILRKLSVPHEWKEIFPEGENRPQPLYWIKVILPPNFTPEDIHDIFVGINAFPVVNSMLYSRLFRNNDSMNNIITLPVKPGEYFLSVDSVHDSYGRNYYSLPYSSEGFKESGTYTVKRGGLERFDTRSAADLISHLTDLFRSEAATFMALQADSLRHVINDMGSLINIVKYKMENNIAQLKEVPTYLLLDGFRENRDNTIYTDYRVTNCEAANGIRSGTPFKTMKSLDVKPNSAVLLCPSFGGKAIPDAAGRVNAYKFALTSRDRLYTDHDIENFLRYELGEKLKSVEIKKGIMCSPRMKEGLIRTIDAHIMLADRFAHLKEDKAFSDELKAQLEQRSPDSFNYRVIFDN